MGGLSKWRIHSERGITWTRFTLSGTNVTAVALDVDLLGLAKFTAVGTLGNRSPLLLYLEEWTVCVFTGGRAMSLDAGVAVTGKVSRRCGIYAIWQTYQEYFFPSMTIFWDVLRYAGNLRRHRRCVPLCKTLRSTEGGI